MTASTSDHQRREAVRRVGEQLRGSSAACRTCRPCRARRRAARRCPGVASAAASGSQVWNGHSGALMANAMKKPRNSHFCVVRVDRQAGRASRKSNVPVPSWSPDTTYSPMSAASMSRPPNRRVEQELHRGVGAPRAAVAADQEVDRDQHRLEEDVEQEHVGGERRRRPCMPRARASARSTSLTEPRGLSSASCQPASTTIGTRTVDMRDQHQRDAVDADGVAARRTP